MQRAIVLAILAFASLPAIAQFHGVPPSVTSIRPGEFSSSAPPASVTSMGPFRFEAPRGKFFSTHPQFFQGHPRFKGHGGFGGGLFGTSVVAVPYYVPYPGYSYSEEAYNDATQPVEPERQPVILVPYEAAPAAVPSEPPAAQAAPVAPVPSEANLAPLPEQEATILVFRDGRRIEVRNYAIVGEELINLSGKGPHRIPLADLDVAATTRENDDRGVSFHVPRPRGS